MLRKVYEVKTLEEAKELALQELGLTEDEITLNILSEKKGFLGIGKKLEVEAVTNVDGANKGKEYIQMILDANEFEGFIEKKVRGKHIEFNVDAGESNGFLIGKNARNLIAIQTLLSIVVNRYYEDSKVVTVDVGGYKQRRERNIESMAVEYGKQVARTKQKIELDQLNAYERKIIHNKLSTWKDVVTYSVGEEPDRYLVIEPKK